MLLLPKSLKVTRSKKAEANLLQKTREWLESDNRDPRVHVSDVLDPLQGYWQRMEPMPIPDQLVNMFMIGKVGHAFIIGAVEGDKNPEMDSDEGSKYSKDLDIVYSIDMNLKGKGQKKAVPREIKTSRTFYEPKELKDLAMYAEQVLSYSAAEDVPKAQIWILLINYKDPVTKRTNPQYRCFTLTVSDGDLKWYQQQVKHVAAMLNRALKKKDPSNLPLCRPFKCGEGNCQWWKLCKPKGRYGEKKKDWPSEDEACYAEGITYEISSNEPRTRTVQSRGRTQRNTATQKRGGKKPQQTRKARIRRN